ncbi:MAG: Sec-independent protein translocase protein TatB, partial [Pseudomonadota bacterium]
MFSNFAWSEMLIIACVAIIVVGPKDLPGMLRTFGKTLGSIKRMAGDFQRQFNDALRETELDELKDMTSTKGFAPLEDAKKSMEEFAQTMKDPVDS